MFHNIRWTNVGGSSKGRRRSNPKPGILKSRAMKIVEAAKPKLKSPRVSRRCSDTVVSAAPAHAASEAADRRQAVHLIDGWP
jgi:hypothetical protein